MYIINACDRRSCIISTDHQLYFVPVGHKCRMHNTVVRGSTASVLRIKELSTRVQSNCTDICIRTIIFESMDTHDKKKKFMTLIPVGVGCDTYSPVQPRQ